jgi:PilZ domain
MQERDSIRSKALLEAYIRYQNRTRSMGCVVRNISLSGARLEVDPTVVLPNEFELDIPHRGAMVQCALKWRKDGAAGVKFLIPAVRS